MIIEDQLDRGAGRIGGVEKLEEFDELRAAMAVPDQGVDLAGEHIDPCQQAERAMAFVFVIAGKVACTPGSGAKSGAVVAMASIPGFSSQEMMATAFL
jgi:hypothetical protein